MVDSDIEIDLFPVWLLRQTYYSYDLELEGTTRLPRGQDSIGKARRNIELGI